MTSECAGSKLNSALNKLRKSSLQLDGRRILSKQKPNASEQTNCNGDITYLF
jgi:hypothetical protein